MLTATQLKQRDGKLTASRVGVLMSGDEAKILKLWQEMLGLESAEDLSGVWPVRLGEATEDLQLQWYEHKAGGPVAALRGKVEVHPTVSWAACTLDGFDVQRKCPIECKHCGGREPLETIIARYMPQMHWQMLCTDTKECALSVIMGANEPIVEYIPFDGEYAKELMARAEAFMLCVQTLTPPVALPAVVPPVVPAKEYDFSGNPDWQLLAGRWVQSYGAAQTAKEAEKQIKGLVPEDAKKAFGAGIVVTRNRAGAMSLREMK